VCLRDHSAVREVLTTLDPALFTGRTVVNLSSATPDEGRRTAAWAAQRGITYLTGAIMVPTYLVREARDAGHGADGFSRVIENLRAG
jgi:3-hydroxyisobutyrate dehydrogenase-like beta-hydroxyacid dehydrogenase